MWNFCCLFPWLVAPAYGTSEIHPPIAKRETSGITICLVKDFILRPPAKALMGQGIPAKAYGKKTTQTPFLHSHAVPKRTTMPRMIQLGNLYALRSEAVHARCLRRCE